MEDFHKDIFRMQDKLKQYIDDPSAAVARDITDNFQKLEDEVQVGKNVNTIRDRLKIIRRLVESADGSVISHPDADAIEKWIDNALQKYR
jgi:hypothetical protein